MRVLGLVDEFAATHPDVVVCRGGETYIACEAAEAIIDEAERRGIRILGLEGFLIADNATYPALGRITDYSAIKDAHRTAEAARSLLRGPWRMPPGSNDQIHPQAIGRHMLALVLDEGAP